jgi:predicted DNA-binding WGR domain protein
MTYLEFVGEDKTRGVAESSKFWQVTQEGSKLTIVFGKIGTNGQTTEKSFSSSEEAKIEMDKLIKSKLKKGYQEKTK